MATGGWTLYKIGLRKDQLSAEWARHNANQAAREAEIRRPAREIKVMSNEESYRMGLARIMKEDYLKWFFNGIQQRDQAVRLRLHTFFTNAFPLDPNAEPTGQEKHRIAVATVESALGDAFIAYSQSRCDPLLKDTYPRDEDNERLPLDEPVYDDMGDYTLKEVCKVISDITLPFDIILDPWDHWKSMDLTRYAEYTFKGCIEAEEWFTASEKENILQKLTIEGEMRDAYIAILLQLYLDFNPFLELCALAIIELAPLLPENAGPIPEHVHRGWQNFWTDAPCAEIDRDRFTVFRKIPVDAPTSLYSFASVDNGTTMLEMIEYINSEIDELKKPEDTEGPEGIEEVNTEE